MMMASWTNPGWKTTLEIQENIDGEVPRISIGAQR